MGKRVRIFSWESGPRAADRVLELLEAEGAVCDWREVSNLEELKRLLEREEPDVVLAGNGASADRETLKEVGSKLPDGTVVSLPDSEGEEWQGMVRGAVRRAVERHRLRRLEAELQQTRDALKESTLKYQTLFQGVNDAVLLLSGDEVVDCNGRASSIFAAGRELIVNASYLSLLPAVQPDGVSSAFRIRKLIDATMQGTPQVSRLFHRHFQGSSFCAELSLSSVRLNDGDYLQAIVRDETGRQEAEVAKTQMEIRLRQAQKMESIGTLAGGIAHDFNNILGAIIGYTHLAKQDAAGFPEVLESLFAVEKASKRARDLVKQILAFSRHEEPERKSIRLQEVLNDAVKFVRASLPSTVGIESDIDPGTGPVLADATQIHQVILNLATNAAHAMNQHGILKIGLKGVQVDAALARAYPELHPGEHARLTVSDTGCGMDRRTQERIFDPFFTTKGPGEGTGLGLAVVHGIVKSHEGVVALQSAVGKGSTFRVYLPVRGAGEASHSADTVQITKTAGQRILFVDDEPSLAKVGKKLLERLGHHVTICCDSLEAVELFRTDPSGFDLVITDQTMPRMEGAEMSRRMLEIRPDIPIILTTGYTTRITPEQSRVMGIREMLLKPISGAALGNAVERVLGKTEGKT